MMNPILVRVLVPIQMIVCLFLVANLFIGCAYGPQTKDKTFLESLNGNNYETGPIGAGTVTTPTVPIVKRRRANVRISGKVYLNQDSIPLPLANQNLSFSQDGKTQAAVRSEVGGIFSFLGDFPDGPGIIRIDSPQYSGERVIQIKGFALENIDLFVEKK